MKFFRLLGVMSLGAMMMVLLLAWVAQFFGPREAGIPVIRLSPMNEQSQATEPGNRQYD